MSSMILVLVLCVALIGANGLLPSPILLDIASEFDASVSATGRALAAYGGGTGAAALIFGRSLDRFGHGRALRLAMLAAAVGQAASALAPGWESLTIAQAVTGAGAGVALPAIYAITAAISPPGREARVLSRVLMGWSLALMAAVPLGAALGDAVGWRATLGASAGLCLAAAAMLGPTVRAAGHRGASARNRNPFSPLALPDAPRRYGVCLLFMIVFYGLVAYTGAHVRESFGVSTAAAGLTVLVYGAGFGLGALSAGLLDRTGVRRAFPAALLVACFALSGLALARNYAVFLMFFGFWGFVNQFILNMILTGLNALAPTGRGAVLGLYSAVTYLGGMLGVLLMGAMFEAAGYAVAVLVGLVLHGLALALAAPSSIRGAPGR